MVSADRQRIIESNRSLRTIKNELESLLEKGILSDASYDSIMDLLPGESSLSSASAPTLATTSSPSTNLSLPLRKAASPAAAEPVAHPPPAYTQTTNTSPMPVLPPRKSTAPSPAAVVTQQAQPPPPTPAPAPVPAAAPEKPVLCRARALYKYNAQDSRDCGFDKDDRIDVYEYMNADWWMGRNCRTGAEGIFPRNYVEPLPADEKNPAGPGMAIGAAGSSYPAPPPPGAGNPYNSDTPPMAVANHHGGGGGEGENKGKEMGKKFGKKLGNAAIFGAGATIGSNIVNGIF